MARFDLNDARRGVYLHHRSQLGEFFLGSDSVFPTFTRWGFAKAHPEFYTEEENKAFMAISYTIGGMMVFPANRSQGKWTINQARTYREYRRRSIEFIEVRNRRIDRHAAGPR